MTTHIFLDVDGVLNAVPTSPERQASSGWGNWHSDYIMGYKITWSEDMVAALNELASRDDVQFHWLTTWEDHAKTDLIPVLGLKGEEWPVLKRGSSYGSWWKLFSLDFYLEDNEITRFVWVDDDHIYWPSAATSMDHRRHEWLDISPATDVALTRAHLDAIVEFVDGGPGRDLSWLDRSVDTETEDTDLDF